MATKRSGIAFMYGLAIGLLVAGVLWVFVLPDGGRSRLGLDRDGAGWFGIVAGVSLLVAGRVEITKSVE